MCTKIKSSTPIVTKPASRGTIRAEKMMKMSERPRSLWRYRYRLSRLSGSLEASENVRHQNTFSIAVSVSAPIDLCAGELYLLENHLLHLPHPRVRRLEPGNGLDLEVAGDRELVKLHPPRKETKGRDGESATIGVRLDMEARMGIG